MTDTTARTHVVLVLDETGSMQSIRNETVDGLKEWLSGLQAELPGDTPVTFVRFNSAGITRAVDGARIDGVTDGVFDDYAPDHMTPLYDAIGVTIAETEKRVEKDDGVIFTIMTDGHENASQEYEAKQIFEGVGRLKKKGWKFMFLGVDIDAYGVGRHLGFAADDTVSMKRAHMKSALGLQRAKAGSYDRTRRAQGVQEAAAQTSYSEEEKRNLGDES